MKRFSTLLALLFISNAVVAGSEVIDKASFDKEWPLTVDSGTLSCEQVPGVRSGQLVTFTTQGKTYAVNGTAKGHAKNRGWIEEIRPIWKDHPDVPGLKIPISSLIDRGLQLCR